MDMEINDQSPWHHGIEPHEDNESPENNEPKFDLRDLFDSTGRGIEKDKVEPPKEKFNEGDLQKLSKGAADLILRNDDFGYGVKRERLEDTFRQAASKGPEAVKQLADAINKELESRNSPLRLEGKYQSREEVKDEADYPKDGRLIYIHPSYYKYTHAGADFAMKNHSTGQTEDRMSVKGKELQRQFLGHNYRGDSYLREDLKLVVPEEKNIILRK